MTPMLLQKRRVQNNASVFVFNASGMNYDKTHLFFFKLCMYMCLYLLALAVCKHKAEPQSTETPRFENEI